MNEPNERSLRGKRVGIYARFSSDKQNANSADDQVARCLRLVVERGGKVSPTCCFKDAAISGASLQRPEFERMMGLVRSRQLDVVVVEDPDRLSRDMADSAFLFKEMAFYDVELLSASDGMSSFSPAAKTHFLLKGFMGEMFLDNLRDKTLRGQTARFNAGFATGGVAFGYPHDAEDEWRWGDHRARHQHRRAAGRRRPPHLPRVPQRAVACADRRSTQR